MGRPKSLYADLLDQVLAHVDPIDRSVGPAALAARLVALRRELRRHPVVRTSGWVPGALAPQLVYDAALVTVARLLGVGAGSDPFDLPGAGRRHLEEAIRSGGLALPNDAADGTPTGGDRRSPERSGPGSGP